MRMLHPKLREGGPKGSAGAASGSSAGAGAGAAKGGGLSIDLSAVGTRGSGLVVPGSPMASSPMVGRSVGPPGALRADPGSFTAAAGAGAAAPTAAIAGLPTNEAKPGDYDERGERDPMIGALLSTGVLSPRLVWWYAQQLRRQAARQIASSASAGATPTGAKGVVATSHLMDEVLGRGVAGSTATSGGIHGSSSSGDLAALTGQATEGAHGRGHTSDKEAASRTAGGSDPDDEAGGEEGGPIDVGSMRAQVQWCDRLLKVVLEREHAYHLAYAAGDGMYQQPLRRDGAR